MTKEKGEIFMIQINRGGIGSVKLNNQVELNIKKSKAKIQVEMS